MPSGGARSGAGRPQDPNALDTSRRKDSSGLIVLPSTGREGDPPVWPLFGQSEREVEMWAAYWRKPQSIVWEQNHWTETVALFVRQFCEGETPGNSAENRKAIQSYFTVLLLTAPALKSAGYRIGEVETQQATRSKVSGSSRSRLRAVPDVDEG